jgi:hypothetical protein
LRIPIYSAEASLAELIHKNNFVSYASLLELNPDYKISPAQVAKLPKVLATNQDQIDLYYLRSILVTTGWNLNEDVFDPKEVWAARTTPEDKPFNVGHNVTDIIGHITDVCPVDDEYKVIANHTTVDKLPTKFHLMVNSVIYKCLEGEAQERIDKIIAEIGEGKWYVSMEALFSDFDYALLYKDGSHKIVARNNDTAFLTKHLRCYGGTGLYKDARIGRLMRHIIFAGKGLVERPANPESKIFANILSLDKNLGYITNSKDINTGDQNKMSAELETSFKKVMEENKELKSSIEKLQASLNEVNEKNIKSRISELETSLKTKSDLVEDLQKKLTASAEETLSLKKQIEEFNTKLEAANKELSVFNLEKKKNSRAKVLAEATKLSLSDAESIVENLISLTDESFTNFVEKSKDKYTVAKTNAATVVETAKPEKTESQVVAPIPEIENTRKQLAAFLSDTEVQENK